MKYFGILALAVIATCVASSYAQSHNFNWGNVGAGDRLLQQSSVVKKGKILRVVTEDITYPMPGSIGGATVTAVRVIDQYTNGKGGYASLLSGGPGSNHVKIHLKSQRGNGIKFLVEIYGR